MQIFVRVAELASFTRAAEALSIPKPAASVAVQQLETMLGTRLLHRTTRKVRKDATLRFAGKWLEVRAELIGRKVQLRFDPTDPDALPRVFVDDRFHCDTVLLDRVRNASRRRHAPSGEPDPQVEATGLDPLDQMLAEHCHRTRPTWGADNDDDNDDDDDEQED